MKTKVSFLLAGILAALVSDGVSQPVITEQPQSQTVVVGMNAKFGVTATGTDPLDYQWYFGPSSPSLFGQTNATLLLTNVQFANAGNYSVVITNADGAVTSLVATLTVLVTPSISKQPTSFPSVSLGANVTNRVFALGTPPVSYQWWFNGTALDRQTNSSIRLTDVQLTNAGDYVVVVANSVGSVTSLVEHLDVDPTFIKITTGDIVTYVGPALGCAWGDYDNDGFMDLFVAVPAAAQIVASKNLFYHNKRDGTFTSISSSVITSEYRDWRGCSWVDYNNDGNLDLFVTSNSGFGFAAQNELFENNGNGTFTKTTQKSAGDIDSPSGGEGCVWADYDRDGFLDAFLANYGPDSLIHNNTDGTFSTVVNSLFAGSQDSYTAAWGDYNNDGWPDLFVAVKSDPPGNLLYLNRGGGSFESVTSGSIVTDRAHSFGCAWGDYDNDGYPDLFVSNGGYVACETNFLYHNNGDGTFTRMTSAQVGSLASDVGGFRVGAWGDYDNDGFLDLFFTSYQVCGPAQTYLYHNNGDGSFTRILAGSVVNDPGAKGGGAWVDYNNDGFLDLFVCAGLDTNTTSLLYLNSGNSNAWIEVKLVGVASNRSAIGAKVRAHATIGGKPMWQLREIDTGNGIQSGPLVAHFGLGDSTNIDQLRIEWPSGIVQTLTNVAPRQILTVVESQSYSGPVAAFGPSIVLPTGVQLSINEPATGAVFVVEASMDLVKWTKLAAHQSTGGIFAYTDKSIGGYSRRFYRVVVP